MLAWLGSAAVACQSEVVPATQVIVEISSELELETELSSIVVQLGSADGSGAPSEEREFQVGVDPTRTDLVQLPLRFAVLPGREQRFRISVIGYGPTGADGRLEQVIEQRAITSFRTQKTLLLPLVLAKICHRVVCAEATEQVCYPASVGATAAGSCGPVPSAPGVVIDPGRG